MDFPVRLLIAGLAAAATAGVAWLGDHRRTHRRDPDAVGFMPWTVIFLCALLLACVLLGLAVRTWFAG